MWNDCAARVGGRIVGVSSISGIAGNLGQTNYATSKAGVIGRVQSMAKPLRARGITLDEAHVLSGRVKSAICHAAPRVSYVLVHMEPFVASLVSGQSISASS